MSLLSQILGNISAVLFCGSVLAFLAGLETLAIFIMIGAVMIAPDW